MSNIAIKTDEDIAGMREAGRLAAEVLEMIEPHVVPGITTGELDRICHDHIVNVQKAIPAPLNYKGFPKSICTSVNEVICHGIPSEAKILKQGDIINIDVTVIKDGWHGDTSIMVPVGKVAPHAERLMRVTQECLYKGLALVAPGARLGDIGQVIQQYAESSYYSVVREYCGHDHSTHAPLSSKMTPRTAELPARCHPVELPVQRALSLCKGILGLHALTVQREARLCRRAP